VDDRSSFSGLASRKMVMVEKKKSRLDMKTLLEGYPSLQQIMQNIKQVVWVLDLSTDHILYVSPGFEIVWGRSCESL